MDKVGFSPMRYSNRVTATVFPSLTDRYNVFGGGEKSANEGAPEQALAPKRR